LKWITVIALLLVGGWLLDKLPVSDDQPSPQSGYVTPTPTTDPRWPAYTTSPPTYDERWPSTYVCKECPYDGPVEPDVDRYEQDRQNH
jgi:hypothetical protein